MEHRHATRAPNLGYKPRTKEGYFPVPPMDHFQDLRSEMILHHASSVGIEIEVHHHEVATAGQAEIDMRFDTLLRMADKLMLYKYVVKNVAWAAGKTATFMPKPIFQDNGSGMHTHQSLWKGGEPLFYDETGYAGLSDIGPLVHRRPARSTPRRSSPSPRPTTNSLQAPGARLRGAGQPRLLPAQPLGGRAASRCTRRARRPSGSSSAAPTRRATRTWPSRPCCMAGLDGVQNRIEPPDPVDKDLYDLPPEELAKVPQVPGSLDEALARPRGRQRLPEGRRRLHRRPHRDLDRLQADQRDRRHPPAPPPLRVRPLLRHLTGRAADLRKRGSAASLVRLWSVLGQRQRVLAGLPALRTAGTCLASQ